MKSVVFTFFTFLAWNPLAAAGKTPEGISLWAGATLWSFGHKPLAKSGVAPAHSGVLPASKFTMGEKRNPFSFGHLADHQGDGEGD